MAFKQRVPGARAVRHVLGLERPRHPEPSDYHKPILSLTDGGELIHALLIEGRPALFARIGGMELDCLMYYFRHRCRGWRRPYPKTILYSMSNNTGFFPARDDTLDAFVREYLAAIARADAMGVWFNIGEDLVVREFCPDADLIPLRSIEPYYHKDPWSRGLNGLKVLVIHPFAESIGEQYESRRERLFDDPDVLPPFDLSLIKAVQSGAGEAPAFDSWFDALDSMRAAMDAIAYDVCVVGAGAYGLPLAAHAKESGKIGIHMGGATQILFGIKGRRWDDHEVISKLYRDSWVRPKASEVPRDAMAVEDGCYW